MLYHYLRCKRWLQIKNNIYSRVHWNVSYHFKYDFKYVYCKNEIKTADKVEKHFLKERISKVKSVFVTVFLVSCK